MRVCLEFGLGKKSMAELNHALLVVSRFGSAALAVIHFLVRPPDSVFS